MSIPSCIPEGKSAISYLLEVCQKRKIQPNFEALAQDCNYNEPQYVIRLTCGEITTVTGKGVSKRKAKITAAILALKKLGALSNDYVDVEEQIVVDGHGNEISNPIGKLTEFAQKHMLSPPTFEFGITKSVETPNIKEYTCTAALGALNETVSGRTKKVVKRAAAIALLKNLTQYKNLKTRRAVGNYEEVRSAPNRARAEEDDNDGDGGVPSLDTQLVRQIIQAEGSVPIDFELVSHFDAAQVSKHLPEHEAAKMTGGPLEEVVTMKLFDEAKILSKLLIGDAKQKPFLGTIIAEFFDEVVLEKQSVEMLRRLCTRLQWKPVYTVVPSNGSELHLVLLSIAELPDVVVPGVGFTSANAQQIAARQLMDHFRCQILI